MVEGSEDRGVVQKEERGDGRAGPKVDATRPEMERFETAREGF